MLNIFFDLKHFQIAMKFKIFKSFVEINVVFSLNFRTSFLNWQKVNFLFKLIISINSSNSV